MKLRIRDRILSALMGIVILLASAGVILYCLGIFPLAERLPSLTRGWLRWVTIAVCAVIALLGLYGVGMLFRRRREKGFVLQRTEYGDMSISMKALENMVKKCVEAHPELKVSSTKIYRVRAGISVEIRILLMSGVNIPLAVNALQKQIKQYITSCSGVDVHEVRVKVETDLARLAPPAEVNISEDTLTMEQICQHQEQPQTYGGKPAEEPVQEAAAEPEAPAEEAPQEAEMPETADVPEEAVTAEAEPAAEEASETAETVAEAKPEQQEEAQA